MLRDYLTAFGGFPHGVSLASAIGHSRGNLEERRLSLVAKQPNWVSRRIAGETIVVPLAGSIADLDSIFVLDEVGSAIWDLLDGRRSPRDIAEVLCESYEVGPDEATADVTRLLDDLQNAQLVALVPPPASHSTTDQTHA